MVECSRVMKCEVEPWYTMEWSQGRVEYSQVECSRATAECSRVK